MNNKILLFLIGLILFVTFSISAWPGASMKTTGNSTTIEYDGTVDGVPGKKIVLRVNASDVVTLDGGNKREVDVDAVKKGNVGDTCTATKAYVDDMGTVEFCVCVQGEAPKCTDASAWGMPID